MEVTGTPQREKCDLTSDCFEPIPIRPAGYFVNVYTECEIAEDNWLAKASVATPPLDLK